MISIGAVSFLTPWLLLGLLTLPVLWWLLRAVPPRALRRAFPGVRLLLGLVDPERMPERTPWWLLLLRMAALAAAILAFAEPVLNPQARNAGTGPLLLAVDGGWASAPDWADRQAQMRGILEQAAVEGRTAALIVLSEAVPGAAAIAWRDPRREAERASLLRPMAWSPDRLAFADWLGALPDGDFETKWLTDGLAYGGSQAFVAALRERGPVTAIFTGGRRVALRTARLEDGALAVTALRARGERGEAVTSVNVNALGPDPNGVERVLGRGEGFFEVGGLVTDIVIELPSELRNRVARLVIDGVRSTGAVVLTDDAVRRRKVGLIAGQQAQEGQQLVSPLFYLRKALETSVELIEAPLVDTLRTSPDVIVLADVGTLTGAESDALSDWVEKGGLLVRFAGPRLAQSGAGQLEDDPLLPVRLRAGGRSVGGALSWGEPKRLREFPEDSPFFGLRLPDDVDISKQVMAQPDLELPNRVMAALEDGTPLVTGKALGEGRVVLFHVTANAEWSNLPLSGLFVEMLERLAISARGTELSEAALTGRTWQPERVLNGFGELEEPGILAGVSGERLLEGRPGSDAPPGVYVSGERVVAINLLGPEDALAALPDLPDGVAIEGLSEVAETVLGPLLLAAALLLLAVDILATLMLSGRLTRAAVVQVSSALLVLLLSAPQADAQDASDLALRAANNTVLAYVETGDARTDRLSRAGLRGLTRTLVRRTAIEPIAPIAVNLESDELALFPFLYWPVTEFQVLPSEAAYAKLNAYLRTGGMILFDTQDAGLGGSTGASTPNGRMLQRLVAPLDIPPLEPVPADHVLTRSFYLLQAFPGRFARGTVWVEAAVDAETVVGVPFRNLNDGVTPVVFGSNDWASAWAIDEDGNYLYPVGRGNGGARQREIALRFGVNLVMYVMTGNYKSDQVHVPALLERLGQ